MESEPTILLILFHFLRCYIPVIPFAAVQVLFIDHFTHRFIVNFAFHSRNDIEVSECPRFKTVFFEMLDLLKKFFKLLTHPVS